ncbi:hypothetical protein [Acidithiobacillus sp.]|uniref:hypothetical protein n=1 Tax=Acidithiobacillus sp. TaxID=1872118 RepID=UPI003D040D0E
MRAKISRVQREIRTALDFLRAATLLEDFRRVREAARDVGQKNVSACLPVEVIGAYGLLPDAL